MVVFSWTIAANTDQLIGFMRTNNALVYDEDTEEQYFTEAIAFGFLIFRIDIIF